MSAPVVQTAGEQKKAAAPFLALPRVCVIGDGRTGRAVAQQLRDAGTSVLQTTRKKEATGGSDSSLVLDITDAKSVSAASFKGAGAAVICVDAAYWTSPLDLLLNRAPPAHPHALREQAMRRLIPKLKADGVQRVVLVSCSGVTRPWRLSSIATNMLHGGHLGFQWEAERLLRKSGLNYTVVRASSLVDSEEALLADPNAEHPMPQLGQGDSLVGSITRSDLASVVVGALRRPNFQRATFECAAGKTGQGSVNWDEVSPDAVDDTGRVVEATPRHTQPIAMLVGGAGGLVAARLVKRIRRMRRVVWR